MVGLDSDEDVVAEAAFEGAVQVSVVDFVSSLSPFFRDYDG